MGRTISSKYLFIPFLLLLVVFAGLYYQVNFKPEPKKATAKTSQTTQDINPDELWTVVNNWKYGQDGYTYSRSDLLCSLADERLENINGNFSHDDFSDQAIQSLTGSGFTKAGENLSMRVYNPEALVGFWLDSPSHRKNLDTNFTHSCIKCKAGYCAQIFGK